MYVYTRNRTPKNPNLLFLVALNIRYVAFVSLCGFAPDNIKWSSYEFGFGWDWDLAGFGIWEGFGIWDWNGIWDLAGFGIWNRIWDLFIFAIWDFQVWPDNPICPGLSMDKSQIPWVLPASIVESFNLKKNCMLFG